MKVHAFFLCMICTTRFLVKELLPPKSYSSFFQISSVIRFVRQRVDEGFRDNTATYIFYELGLKRLPFELHFGAHLLDFLVGTGFRVDRIPILACQVVSFLANLDVGAFQSAMINFL